MVGVRGIEGRAFYKKGTMCHMEAQKNMMLLGHYKK